MSKSAAKPTIKSDVISRLVITPGEPAGIGPDLFVGLNPTQFDSHLLAVADPAILKARATALGINTTFNIVDNLDECISGTLNVLAIDCLAPVTPGQLNADNGLYVLECLEKAVSLCESHDNTAMVTGPINKAVINESGVKFSGHTEWLAERTGTPRVVMMLASHDLRVALATTHLPLRDVADAITQEDLYTTLEILNRDLISKFNIGSPRILVCGLNPHAGEGGHLGREEIEIIEPTLIKARDNGINTIGPLPADTAFTPECLALGDAVLAMYHDQGLPVLKHQGFGEAVNITLGLPIIRTSVDHGTALDIAGKGSADPGSLITAMKLAEQLLLKNLDYAT